MQLRVHVPEQFHGALASLTRIAELDEAQLQQLNALLEEGPSTAYSRRLPLESLRAGDMRDIVAVLHSLAQEGRAHELPVRDLAEDVARAIQHGKVRTAMLTEEKRELFKERLTRLLETVGASPPAESSRSLVADIDPGVADLSEGSILPERLRSLFEGATGQRFEGGIDSPFSDELLSIVENHGNSALKIIGQLILESEVASLVAAEALEWLGRMEEPATHDSRRHVLEQALQSPSVHIRDGAISALSFLEDPAAIPAIQQAIHQETRPSLRSYMEQVLAQLEDMQQWLSS